MKRIASLIISLILFLSINCNVFGQPTQRDQIIHYEVKMENVKWYQKVALFFLGLDWDTISIKTTFSKDENGIEKIISVMAWPDNPKADNPENSEAAFRLDQSTNAAHSFLYFAKYTQFKPEEVPKLLSLYNYLYDNNLEEQNFSTANLFEKENGSMHCKLIKKRDGDKNLISMQTFNSSGTANGFVEVTMNPLPKKHFEKIYAKLKIGIEITLTPSQPKKPD